MLRCMCITKKVRHIKTGNIYRVLYANVIECTNGREEKEYVVYTRNGKVFCREAQEFWCKFEEI